MCVFKWFRAHERHTSLVESEAVPYNLLEMCTVFFVCLFVFALRMHSFGSLPHSVSVSRMVRMVWCARGKGTIANCMLLWWSSVCKQLIDTFGWFLSPLIRSHTSKCSSEQCFKLFFNCEHSAAQNVHCWTVFMHFYAFQAQHKLNSHECRGNQIQSIQIASNENSFVFIFAAPGI